MTATKPNRAPTGIRQRHGAKCTGGRRCGCPWEAFVPLGRKGEKLRKTWPTRKLAEDWRTEAMADQKRGKLRTPTSTTVEQAAEAFLAGARDGSIPAAGGGRFKPATIRGYTVALHKRLLPAFGKRRLSDVRRADVQEFADALTAEGLRASTVHNTLDPLRVIYRRAIRREEVDVDPTKNLELRRPDGKRDRIADPAEADALLAALHEDRALWATAIYAGLRRGELMALRCSDVDLHGRVIHVQRGWDQIEGEQEGKSAAANRRVPILDPLARELVDHLMRTGRRGDDLVFGATAAKPFSRESVRRRSLAAWEAAGLTPLTLHEARHTCASVMIAAGVNAKALSAIMRHATIAMTFDTYGHLMPGGLDEAAAAANAYLARQTGERPALTVVG